MYKIPSPTKAQAEVIRNHGLFPFIYAVLQEDENSIIVVHRANGVVKHLKKEVTVNER